MKSKYESVTRVDKVQYPFTSTDPFFLLKTNWIPVNNLNVFLSYFYKLDKGEVGAPTVESFDSYCKNH